MSAETILSIFLGWKDKHIKLPFIYILLVNLLAESYIGYGDN